MKPGKTEANMIKYLQTPVCYCSELNRQIPVTQEIWDRTYSNYLLLCAFAKTNKFDFTKLK